ncbi:MAG TPA: hypothetical protein VH249_14730 [Xanthobacteraceae bacterium]|jgi:hypothetical protein|nr:hypothetical protein [Xanthobacteraceae bacterium]
MPNIPLRKPRARKAAFDKFGLGAIALYAGGVIVVACAVYGINLSTVINKFNESERLRAQAQRGQIMVGTEDRTQCRVVRFDNQTSQITGESLVACTERRATDSRSSESTLNGFRDSFTKR